MPLTRRDAIGALPLAMTLPTFLSQADADEVHDAWPTQAPDEARRVVGASHGNFNLVRELVGARPTLAKAAWDWGFGDWETALGAASHTGRREIAEYLIAHGARPDLFTFAMLDQVDVLRPLLMAYPDLAGLPGPHGITLKRHAEAGGAQRVLDLLESFPASGEGPTSLPTDESLRAELTGRYRFGEDDSSILEVLVDRNGNLSMRRAEGAARVLHRIEDRTFAPAGAPHVRVEFAGDSLTLRDGPRTLAASRG